MTTRCALAVLTTVAAATAQSVGVSLTALTPLVAGVTDGVSTAIDVRPVGPLAPNGGFGASLPNTPGPSASANASWNAFASDHYALVTLEHSVANSAGIPTFAGSCGPHELLLEFNTALPRDVTLELTRTVGLAPGAPGPSLQVDFDNDGVVEITNLSAVQPTSVTASFGPQPLRVRLVIGVALGAQAYAYDRLGVVLRPRNDLTIATPVLECAPMAPPPPPFLQPSFDDRGVDLLGGNPLEPTVLVFGFTAQPLLLATNGLLPCVLLPSPDVLLVANGYFHLPLPASVRPVTFYAQGVRLTASGLRTTTGYAVQAH